MSVFIGEHCNDTMLFCRGSVLHWISRTPMQAILPKHIREMMLTGQIAYGPLSDALEEIGLINCAHHIRDHIKSKNSCGYLSPETGGFFFAGTQGYGAGAALDGMDKELIAYVKRNPHAKSDKP